MRKLPQNRIVLRALCGGGYQGLNWRSSNPCGMTGILSRERPGRVLVRFGLRDGDDAASTFHRELLGRIHVERKRQPARIALCAFVRLARNSMLCELQTNGVSNRLDSSSA